MSQLFSKSAIRQAISSFQGLNIDKEIAIVQELYTDFRNGNMKDETRYEQRFNDLFFGQLLDYESGKHRIPQAPTPVGGKRADVALGFFEDNKYTFESVKVMVEFKGSDTLLDKKQASYGGQSPVDQGFGYKTSFKDCPWLIVSNFASVRLYRDNKQDFEVWTIEDLVNPDNEYYNLKTLLGLLKRNHLISQSGNSFSEKLLSEVRIKQEQITKSFYKEYKTLRFELINDIRHNNPDLDVETIVEKSQKIIDRIVFILFCEDKGLLPENKLIERVREFQKRGKTPWQSLLDHFQDIDKGNPAIGIPQYNGGLFHRDEILKTIEVGDGICHKFIDLGKYNFDDELSVNILGHIFEQSISDIEQLKGELLGEEITTDELVEKKESKRKKDGIFYTPEYIVDYIVQNSLMVYLEEKENECLAKYKKDEKKAYETYKNILENVKVLDPACGSGAFLVKVFDYLYKENAKVGDILKQYGAIFSVDEVYKSILRNNIYGVDLNPESVEITKLSLWLKSAQKGKKLNNLDENIKCGNSLIDDPAVADERAFDWQKEFPQIFFSTTPTSKFIKSDENQVGRYDDMFGFDVIVGNPPYVSTKSTKFIGDEKSYFQKKFEVAEYQTDTYPLFVEQGIKILKSAGILGYIMPNSWLNNLKFSKLRKYLLQYRIDEISLLPSGVFSDATVDTINIFVRKRDATRPITVTQYENNDFIFKNKILVDRLLKNDNYIFDLNTTDEINKIIKQIEKKGTSLDDILEFSSGIKEYEIGKGKPPQTIEDKETQKFNATFKINETYIRHLKGNDIENYNINWQGNYLSYGPRLAAPRKEKFFSGPRLIFREIPAKDRMVVGYTNDDFTIKNTAHIGLSKDNKFDLKYILCVVNSRLFGLYFKYSCGEFDSIFPKAKLGQVRMLKVKFTKGQQPFINKANLMLSLNKELHEKSSKFFNRLLNNLKLEKINKKIESFYEMTFAEFVKELDKNKVKLSLKDQDEREDYFNEYKSQIVNLKNQINATDREIDEMVFELYGLSEEERRIVLGN